MSSVLDIIKAVLIAFSFLTTLPVPAVQWTNARLRYFTLVLPLVGIAIGVFGTIFFLLLAHWNVSAVLRAVLMALFYLTLTGGLHMDGLMDTCDAVFSRKDRETRLKILSDTHTGAFAVMGCAAVLLLKAGLFCELFERFASVKANFPLIALSLIPVYSRTGLAMLFHLLPFAKNDGLAKTMGANLDRRHFLLLSTFFALVGFAIIPLAGFVSVAIPLLCLLFLLFYRGQCLNTFGGITGDLLGAFVELSETVMLFAALFV